MRTKWDYVGNSAVAAWACCLLRDGRTVVLSTKDRPLAEEISAWHAQVLFQERIFRSQLRKPAEISVGRQELLNPMIDTEDGDASIMYRASGNSRFA